MPVKITAEQLEAFVQKLYSTASDPGYWDSCFHQAFGAWTFFTSALFEEGRVDESNALGDKWTNKWYPKFWNIVHEQLGIELMEVIE